MATNAKPAKGNKGMGTGADGYTTRQRGSSEKFSVGSIANGKVASSVGKTKNPDSPQVRRAPGQKNPR